MINNFKNNSARPPPLICDKLRFGKWFDRDNPKTYRTVPLLDAYINMPSTWISTRQAQCMTSLKNAPTTFSQRNRTLLEELLIKVKLSNEGDEELDSEVNPLHSLLHKIVESDVNKVTTDHGDNFIEVGKGKAPFRLDYLDPFKIFASRELASIRGVKQTELNVWYADLYNLSDPIPTSLLGPEFRKGLKDKFKNNKPIPFQMIKNIDCKLYVIFNHTHWGNHLGGLCQSEDNATSNWARLLKRRIISLLKGESDPLWTKEQKSLYYESMDNRDHKARSLRFLELLKTVSGMFVQRYVTIPEENWTWEKFDLYNLKNLSFLISDEFFDGECTKEILNIQTFYKSLKNHRKLFKRISFNEIPLNTVKDEVPNWLKAEIPIWHTVLSREASQHKVYQIGLLCQSRGCGTPPLIDVLLAKKKFITTITKEVTPLPTWKRALIKAAMLEIISNIPDHAMTGLTNKAIITVTTAACLGKTVDEGGTTQDIADEINSVGEYCRIPIRDLETGLVIDEVLYTDLDIGERIFWHCLQRILEIDPEELRIVMLLVVKEPAKARCVTKGLSYLKIILDVISKICSHPLKKGVSSSESGMSKESHGWEFYKSFFKTEEEPYLFELESKEEILITTETYNVSETYKTVWISSTDFIAATDHAEHEVNSILSNYWMQKCGIPRVLRGIVNSVCYKPRKIKFHATGPLSDLGHPTETEGIRYVMSSRGILMGDPLTKPCLHLTNIVTRVIAEKGNDSSFLRRAIR